jgi:hypothetical protein
MRYYSRLLIIFLFISTETKGFSPISFSNNNDSTLISNFSLRAIFGSDYYTESSLLKEELQSQSLFSSLDDFFVVTGFSIGISPRIKDITGGVHYIYYFTQTQYQQTDSTSRSLKFAGSSYGIFLEQNFKIKKQLQIQIGLRLLRNSMNLSIHESMDINNPNGAFINSKSLEIVYRSNSINPYAVIEYQFIQSKFYDLSMGLALDYKYILTSSPWKLSKSDIYNDWTYKNSSTKVDLPFFGKSVIGTSLVFTIRTYF